MPNDKQSLFEQLNAPFPYQEYKYDKFGDRCYVSGQTIAERLNKVLGVGFWKYKGLSDTEKLVHEPNGKSQRIKLYVEFSFYNPDLKEWITVIDVGSEQIKPGMNEGDATKSAITDGMKKCASRIGVASDLYKGLINWDKQKQMVIVPSHYKNYYNHEKLVIPNTEPIEAETKLNRRKKNLTEKLKSRNNITQEQIRSLWIILAGTNDGLNEWYKKKLDEGVSDQQIFQILQNKLQKKQNEASA